LLLWMTGSLQGCCESPQISTQHDGRLARTAWQQAPVPGYGKHVELSSPQPGDRGKRSARFPTLAILFRSGQSRREQENKREQREGVCMNDVLFRISVPRSRVHGTRSIPVELHNRLSAVSFVAHLANFVRSYFRRIRDCSLRR
jgi:hypothetical protein